MKRLLFPLLILGALLSPRGATAEDPLLSSKGQTLYVPAYSHIYSGDREKPFLLAVTLSIRNTDPAREVTVTRVDYYDTNGSRIKTYIDSPILLKPMEATRYVVAENDTAGGSGASFLVAWTSEKPVNPPIVESIMIGTQSQQGISFTSRGQVLLRSPK